MIAALVPVKELAETKSRMFPDLDAPARRALSLAMLRDVLAALARAGAVDRRAVVTPDDAVADAAREAGAEVVLFREPGLNAALAAGARALDLGPDDALLIVLGDVAGASPEDLDALCAALPRDGARESAASGATASVVLAAARDGGTAALLCRPCDAIAPCFGPESAKRHREAAEAAGARLRECSLPSLALDLDDADDLRSFMERFESARSAGQAAAGPAIPGANTHALLASLGRFAGGVARQRNGA